MDTEVLSEVDQNKYSLELKRFIVILSLILFSGIIMVYSSSYIFAKEVYDSSTYFLVKQVVYSLLGVLVAFITSKTKTTFWIKYAEQISLFVIFILVLTFIPGIGPGVKGANRWINLFGVSFQPGELVKFTMIFVSVKYFTLRDQLDSKIKLKLLFCFVCPLLLVLAQPDFGTFAICSLGFFFCCFLSNYPRKKFYALLFSGVIAIGFILTLAPYRVQRVLSFLDPWKNPKTSGFQIIQSYLAFSNGSLFGEGIGNSNEKLFYLPEAHNDFIFSVVGEELGFLGVVFLVGLFVLLVYNGFRLAIKEESAQVSLLISCIVFIVGVQASLNMGVVLGLLPTKGLNLPFFSYGGSSLICNFFGVGLLLSAVSSKYRRKRYL